MDRMEDAARNGTREEAQAMLDQMQEMFENMRSGREAEESPAERAMRKQIGRTRASSCATSRRCATTPSAATSAIAGRSASPAQPCAGQDDQAQPDEDQDQGENDQDHVVQTRRGRRQSRGRASSSSVSGRCATASPNCSAC